MCIRVAEGEMSPPVTFVPFYPDSRGNRLVAWTTTDAGVFGHVLWLQGPVEVVRQVVALAPDYDVLPARVSAGSAWTHALQSPNREMSAQVQTLLGLLTEVLSLPSPVSVDFALALDWYKVAEEGVDPYTWRNTAAGEMVYSGKYVYKHNGTMQARCGLQLVQLMCSAAERHGLLCQADAILDIPGHDSARVSFGSRLAATIANRRRIPMIRVTAKSPFRPEAKSLAAAEKEQVLNEEFTVPPEVARQRVLIVDDVFRSGTSMGAIAKAARQSGAAEVYGLCSVRTMRR